MNWRGTVGAIARRDALPIVVLILGHETKRRD